MIPLLAALLLCAPGSGAQTVRGVDPAVLGDYLARAEAFGFSGAVVVAAGDSALVSAGFGLADRVRRIPVTVSTPFYVASLSKQFTAAAIMRLEMAGKLGTRDTLGRFFAGLPPAAARITLHQLLTHTAGTPRGGGRETDPEAYVRRLFAAPLRAAPGTAYAYSNEGYGILAAVIQKVSGRSYGAFLREQLFAPAGMGDSYDLADAPPGLATRAYRGAVDMGDVRLSLGDTVPWDERAGRGIVTTAADLWRWERALRGRAILADSAKRKMFTAEREDYGYGWVIARTPRGTASILHDGLIFPQGWNAQFRRYPDEGVTLVVLSNTFRREPLAQIVAVDLGRLLFGGAVRMPPVVRPAAESERRRMVGSYRLPSGGRLEVREVGGALTIAGEGQDAVNLLQFPKPARHLGACRGESPDDAGGAGAARGLAGGRARGARRRAGRRRLAGRAADDARFARGALWPRARRPGHQHGGGRHGGDGRAHLRRRPLRARQRGDALFLAKREADGRVEPRLVSEGNPGGGAVPRRGAARARRRRRMGHLRPRDRPRAMVPRGARRDRRRLRARSARCRRGRGGDSDLTHAEAAERQR